jgi:hypothetical protein
MGEAGSLAYAFSMLEDDKFLNSPPGDFARTRRIRRLQLICGAMVIFGVGVLVGMSIAYDPVQISVELPAAAPAEPEIPSDTIKA